MKKLRHIAALTALAVLVVFSSSLAASAGEHEVGMGPSDWWISYGEAHSNPGKTVMHPQWVLEALQSRPVLIYGHKLCPYCEPQEANITAVMKEFSEDFEYFEVDADEGDIRILDIIPGYDPDGGASYVPLTVILTLVRDPDGKVVVGWHSSENLTGIMWIRSYMRDALDLYRQNRADWGG